MLSLSICIPVYRTDVRKLVLTLLEQIKRLTDAQVDIVLIDDASGEPFTALNTFNNAIVKQVLLAQNVGRAKIRNLFLQHTNAQYLLFIDGDSTVLNEKFVFNYVQSLCAQAVPVLVGASCYQQDRPAANYLLRWRYSTHRESLNYDQRISKKQAGFKTNNFVIERSVFEQLGFESRLTGYGHEDTLDGAALRILRATSLGSTDWDAVDGQSFSPGRVSLQGGKVLLHCAEGTRLELKEVQPAGKKVMPATDWYRGLTKEIRLD